MGLTEGFKLSPVDVERLPGIAEICQGKLPATLTRALEQAITDATDPRALHDVPRKVSWTLTLLPDADALSAVWRLPKPVKVELAAGHPPPSGRVVFEKQNGVLSARALHVEEHPEAKSPPDRFTAVLLDVPVVELIAGELDLAFKRASILLLLDCDDGRKVVAVERKLSFSIFVIADEERASVQLRLAPVVTKLAPYRDEEHGTQRLYINRGVAQLEADAYLLGEEDPRQQAAIVGGTVSVFKPKGASKK